MLISLVGEDLVSLGLFYAATKISYILKSHFEGLGMDMFSFKKKCTETIGCSDWWLGWLVYVMPWIDMKPF